MTSLADLHANQSAFRHANERLGARLLSAVGSERVVPFICECPDLDCLGRVEMSSAAYDAAHLDRSQFVVLRHHPRVEGEEIVEQNHGYDVVRKPAL